jgi:hypothetical protein
LGGMHRSEVIVYFQDLSMYRYHLPFPLQDVRCVGWLDSEHPYERGLPPVDLAEKLEEIIQHRSDVFDVHVNVVRGIHPCNFCGKDIKLIASRRERLLGMSEIWVPDNSGWLASPSLIVHYITDHGYLPPPAFVHAVTVLSTRDQFLGQEVYDRLVSERTAG